MHFHARQADLIAQLAEVDTPPLLHPSIADLYRSKVEQLASALQREDTRVETSEMLHALIEGIVLTPRTLRLKPDTTTGDYVSN